MLTMFVKISNNILAECEQDIDCPAQKPLCVHRLCEGMSRPNILIFSFYLLN